MSNKNHHITQAFKYSRVYSKPSKLKVYNAILRAVDAGCLPTNCIGGDVDLAMILSYFTTPNPKKVKTAFQWVCRAVAHRSRNTMCTAVYSDGDNIVGNDGSRMHMAYHLKIPEGYYDVQGQLLKLECRYPDYKTALDKVVDETTNDFVDFDLKDGIHSIDRNVAFIEFNEVLIRLYQVLDVVNQVDNLEFYPPLDVEKGPVRFAGNIEGYDVMAIISGKY